MKFIDDTAKNIKWYNKNIFYVCTLFFVFVNVFAFQLGGSSWIPRPINSNWTDVLNFNRLLSCFLSAFEHSNLQHCLLNSLCFLVAGTYLERKIGSVNLFVLVLSLVFFCECAVDANYDANSHGFSGTNFGIYAYIIIDYIFMFLYKKQTKTNIIYGAIILALIYIACCFSGGTSTFAFKWYPHDLITNMGHYTSFLTGIIVTLILQFIKWKTINDNK